jgi:carbonic anhydrase
MSASKVLIACCSDPRLNVWREKYIKERGWKPTEWDPHINPGEVPSLADNENTGPRDVYLDKIVLLFKAHGFKEIVLVTHEDCAAIGGSAKFTRLFDEEMAHRRMLEVAKKNLEVILAPANLTITMIYVSRSEFDALNAAWHE